MNYPIFQQQKDEIREAKSQLSLVWHEVWKEGKQLIQFSSKVAKSTY